MKHATILKIVGLLASLVLSSVLLFSCGEELDLSALEEALSKKVDETLYTTESYELYSAAYEKALSVYNDKNTNETQVEAATDRLNAAVEGLVRRADFTVLKDLMAQSHPAENYTTESYADYRQAMDKAQTICENLDSKQAIVNSAATVLQASIDALEPKADTTLLGSLLATYIQPGVYTTLTYTRYQKIFDEAQDLYEQRTVQMTKEEAADFAQNVTICTQELETAIAGLQKRGDLTALQTRYDALLPKYEEASDETEGKLPSEYYTETSFASFAQAMNETSGVLSSGDYSDSEIQKFLDSLNQSFDALVVRSDTAELEELIITASNFYLKDPSIYSTDSYIALNNTVNAAKDLLTKSNAPQSEIDAAIQKILLAINQLEVVNVSAGGSTAYRFGDSVISFSIERTTVGEYMRNNATFLASLGGLVSDYITPASTTDSLKLMIGNGMEIALNFGDIHIGLQNGVQTVTSGTEIASIAGITLGMTPVEISDLLGGAPTLSQDTGNGTVIVYVDGSTGYELAITLSAATNTVIAIDCYVGE